MRGILPTFHGAAALRDPEAITHLLAGGASLAGLTLPGSGLAPLVCFTFSQHPGSGTDRRQGLAACTRALLDAGASLRDARPGGCGNWGRMLIAEASPEVAEVLRRHGAGDAD